MGEKKKVVYILGPFDRPTGLDDYAAVDDILIGLGYETISPVLVPEGLEKVKAHRIAVDMIDAADAVVVLPNWQESKDAVAEHYLAYCFDKPMVDARLCYPPEVAKACLACDLGRILGEVSA